MFCYHSSSSHFLSSHTANLSVDELLWHYLKIHFCYLQGLHVAIFVMSEIALHKAFLNICPVTSFATLILVGVELNEVLYVLCIGTT